MLTVRPDRTPTPPGTRVLDVGCGRGRHLHAFMERDGVTAVGVDLNLDDLTASREGLVAFGGERALVARADALRLPFADGAFDLVVCSEVLEHLPDYQTALDEIDRVTRPGGAVAVSVPRAWPEKICWRLAPEYAQEPGGHVRIFAEDDLTDAVTARQLRPTGRHHAHGLHSPYWWLKCALWARHDDHPVIRVYQRFLEWDILHRPWLTRALAALADPIMGKSVVLYFEKPA